MQLQVNLASNLIKETSVSLVTLIGALTTGSEVSKAA